LRCRLLPGLWICLAIVPSHSAGLGLSLSLRFCSTAVAGGWAADAKRLHSAAYRLNSALQNSSRGSNIRNSLRSFVRLTANHSEKFLAARSPSSRTREDALITSLKPVNDSLNAGDKELFTLIDAWFIARTHLPTVHARGVRVDGFGRYSPPEPNNALFAYAKYPKGNALLGGIFLL
jgi:hypothetical protein